MTSGSSSSSPPQSGTEIEANAPPYCECPSPGRRGRPSVAEAEQLSGRILDAAWEILLQSGFENFTFDRVARHARIGKATIYSRFIGKRELMHALMLRRIEARRAMLMAEGSALPLKEAFCMRATRILDMLHTPEQKLLERLIDWFDQESGAGKTGTRATAYRGGINAIVEQLQAANDAGLATIVNLHQAAQFWLEGLLGHARITESEGSAEPHQHESWARQFTEFFFAGLTALQPPTEE